MQDDEQPQPRSDQGVPQAERPADGGETPPAEAAQVPLAESDAGEAPAAESGQTPPADSAPDSGQEAPARPRPDRPRVTVVRDPRASGPPLLPRVLLALPTLPWAVLYFLATILFFGVALGAVVRGHSRVAYGMENGEAVWAVVLVSLLLLAGALTLTGVGLAAVTGSRRTVLWAVLAIAAAVLTVVAVVIGVRAGASVGWWLALSFGFPYATAVSVYKLWSLARERRPKVAAP